MSTTPLDAVSIQFPPEVYSDVRLERAASCEIVLRDGELHDVRRRVETGALLRVHKGGRWYYAATTDLDSISEQLAVLATSTALGEGPDGPTPPPHQARVLRFAEHSAERTPLEEKLTLLKAPVALLDRPAVQLWTATWRDACSLRRFVSSAGADVTHDFQILGCRYAFAMADGEGTFQESFQFGGDTVAELREAMADTGEFRERLERCERFLADAVAVKPGDYRVILSPIAAGVFAHESFGHKSEADFMLGDPSMLESWKMGTTLGMEGLSIIDDGTLGGSGYVPFDDEGQPAQRTWLIKDGALSGRLHSHLTATALGEEVTGNARAMSFRFEPIVRMTTTVIQPGDLPREQLFAEVEDGYYIETIKHGSGMSRFTIAPSLAWRIRGGELAEPVRIAVLTGTVFGTLGEVDGLSDTVEVTRMAFGGCGKMEQFPLPVGMGGPYVRIARMEVA
jgi:TldD protein